MTPSGLDPILFHYFNDKGIQTWTTGVLAVKCPMDINLQQ